MFLGTRLGHVLRYSIHHRDDEDAKVDIQLLDYDKNFSKKPIIQIEVVPEYQLLFSLSDSQINVNDISKHHFPLVYSEPKTRGATLFTMKINRTNSMTGETALIALICVAVKRKLQFYYWKKQTLIEYIKDIELNDVPKAMAWYHDFVCVGFKSEYVIYKLDAEKGVLKFDLFPTSSARSIDPCITIINNVGFAVAKDDYVIVVDPLIATADEKDYVVIQGSSQMKSTAEDSKLSFRSIAWSSPLQTMVWDEPYAVGLINDCVEIRTLDNDKEPLIQKIAELPRARLLIQTQKGILIAASVSLLWQIKAVEIPIQIERLINAKNFKLALELVGISNETEAEKNQKSYQIREKYAYDLFENKNFHESMDEFAKLNSDPCVVIKLFPNLSQDGASGNTLDDRDLEDGLMALTYFLNLTRQKIKKVK